MVQVVQPYFHGTTVTTRRKRYNHNYISIIGTSLSPWYNPISMAQTYPSYVPAGAVRVAKGMILGPHQGDKS